MAEKTPIWKKEIHLRSRPPASTATPESRTAPEKRTESTSLWKQELRLFPLRFTDPSEVSPTPQRTSIWKKEIGRKQAQNLAPSSPATIAPEGQTADWPTEKHELWTLPPEPRELPEPRGAIAPPTRPLLAPQPTVVPPTALPREPYRRAEPQPAVAPPAGVPPEPYRRAEPQLAVAPPAGIPTEPFALPPSEQPSSASPGSLAETETPSTDGVQSEETGERWFGAPARSASAASPDPAGPPATFAPPRSDPPPSAPVEWSALPAVPEPEVPAAAAPEPGAPLAASDLGQPESESKVSRAEKLAPSSRRRRNRGRTSELVGLRVGSSHLGAALVRNEQAGPELIQLAQGPLERGVVVAGEVREPDALANAVRQFFAEHKLPRRAVRLGIASNRIGVRVLEVPAIADSKLLENAIRFRAQELLSIPITEAVLDHIVLGESQGKEGKMLRVLVAFAHRELIDRYVEACKKARVRLVGIDFDAFALLRAVSDPSDPALAPDRATVAISIGHERTIFAVSEGGLCDFTRVLEWGGASLNVGLARALNLTPSEAGPIKHGLSLAGDAYAGELSPVQVEAARAALRTELQVLGRELLASLQFYQSRPGSLAIGEILLTGGGAQLGGIGPELGRIVGVPVRMADPFGRVVAAKKVKLPADPGSLVIAVGLAIEGS